MGVVPRTVPLGIRRESPHHRPTLTVRTSMARSRSPVRTPTTSMVTVTVGVASLGHEPPRYISRRPGRPILDGGL